MSKLSVIIKIYLNAKASINIFMMNLITVPFYSDNPPDFILSNYIYGSVIFLSIGIFIKEN